MAESESTAKESDVLYEKLLNKCEGQGAEKAAAFCDEVFDFLRRKKMLHLPRCGALIKQRLNARVATAKEEFMSPNKPKIDEMNMRREAAKKQAEMKKKAEAAVKKQQIQTEEIEELDPAQFKPETKTEDVKMEVDDEEEESGDMPNAGNGGDNGKYSWTQTLDEVDVRVEVPAHMKGRHLDVKVTKNRILVGIKGGDPPIIDGELEAEVSESMWTLESDGGKKYVCINMDKRKGMCWWKRVVKGDVGIKTKKIQPENSKLSDLDGETRQTVEKMMFDQRQREMGKPTSKELDQRAKLEKFMKAHPEMDFSNAKFSGGGFGGGMGGFPNNV